jgi:hypothetical protein
MYQMRVTLHGELDIELPEDTAASEDSVRKAILETFKDRKAVDPLQGAKFTLQIGRKYTKPEQFPVRVVVLGFKLPRGAERAPAAYIRFDHEG